MGKTVPLPDGDSPRARAIRRAMLREEARWLRIGPWLLAAEIALILTIILGVYLLRGG